MLNSCLKSNLCGRAAALAMLLAGCGALVGCANMGDSMVSGAFVDPAKYELFDCKQLEAERKSLEARTTQLQGLIDKAKTGVAGSVVGEAVYRNDYISTRASLKSANEAWERNKCVASAAPVTPPPPAPSPKRGGRAGH